MPIPRDPRLNDAGAEPDIVIVLAGILIVRDVEDCGVAFREARELRSADLVHEPQQSPVTVAATLVAEERIHEVTGTVFDAIDLATGGIDEGLAYRDIGRAAADRFTG